VLNWISEITVDENNSLRSISAEGDRSVSGDAAGTLFGNRACDNDNALAW
jgi:hypothetical protein